MNKSSLPPDTERTINLMIEEMRTMSSNNTEKCKWKLTGTPGNYTLIISGDGPMQNYINEGPSWYSYRNDIKILEIQEGVTHIGRYAFFNCSVLASVTIPNSVTSIGHGAFTKCERLISVTIPSSVTSIIESAFQRCYNLQRIDVDAANPNYRSIDGIVFNKSNNVLLICPNGKTGHYVIPNSVIFIGKNAFSDCKLTSVTIPTSVTYIGMYAFTCCKLTSVTIPNSVTSIEGYTFRNCESLTSVTIPNSVTSIGECSFENCKCLISVIIPNSVKRIGNSAFEGCKSLTSVIIGNSVKSIGESAFINCSQLQSIEVDSSNPNYSSVDGVLFNKSQTTLIKYPTGKTGHYTVPNSITTIDIAAFEYCEGLTSVIIPNSVRSIRFAAFHHCTNLTSVTFGNSVEPIGEYSFVKCTGLTSITILNSMTSISGHTFDNCNNLTQIRVKATNPPLVDNKDFWGVSKNIPVHVPRGTAASYKNANGWKNFTNIIDDE